MSQVLEAVRTPATICIASPRTASRFRTSMMMFWLLRWRSLHWPAATKTGHIDHSTLKKQHYKALRVSGVRPFVLYSLRHTFLTRLGESGCGAWTLARIAGHSSVAISSRYVHPSEDAVLGALSRLGGHNSGHSVKMVNADEVISNAVTTTMPEGYLVS